MRRFIVPAFLLILLGIPAVSSAASLSISPSSGTYSVGDQIPLRVVVSSSGAPLNALSAVLRFPPSSFSVQSISKAGSVLNFWVTEPAFSNSAGTLQLEAVSLAGFQGSSGTVVTVVLRALKVGAGTVSFQSGQVLANDGQGTDVTSGLSGGTFQIIAAKLKPPAKPTPIATPAPTSIPTPVSTPVVQEDVKPKVPVVQTLTAPIISLEDRNGVSVIVGTVPYSNVNVLLTFVPVTGSKLFITGLTNKDGNFVLPVPQALRNGPYAVSAIAVLLDGSQTPTSNILTVEVGGKFSAVANWESATYASLFLIILLLALLGYFISRRHFNPKKSTPAAIDALHSSITQLDHELSDRLEDASGVGQIDDKERAVITGLKKDLKDTEEYIDKEMQDINLSHFDEKK